MPKTIFKIVSLESYHVLLSGKWLKIDFDLFIHVCLQWFTLNLQSSSFHDCVKWRSRLISIFAKFRLDRETIEAATSTSTWAVPLFRYFGDMSRHLILWLRNSIKHHDSEGKGQVPRCLSFTCLLSHGDQVWQKNINKDWYWIITQMIVSSWQPLANSQIYLKLDLCLPWGSLLFTHESSKSKLQRNLGN